MFQNENLYFAQNDLDITDIMWQTKENHNNFQNNSVKSKRVDISENKT